MTSGAGSAAGAATARATETALPPEIAASVEQRVADQREVARAAKGKISITRAWPYDAAPRLPAGRRWVAVDVDLAGLPIEVDDLELADAAGSTPFSLADVHRLDRAGNLVGLHGASVGASRYLLLFDALATTRRISLRYGGENLTAPVEIAASGPVFAEPRREVIRHFVDGDRHVLVIEDHNQPHTPGSLGVYLPFDSGRCAMRGIVPVDHRLAVTELPAVEIVPHAFYVADFSCAKPPTGYGLRSERALLATERLALPAATLAALEGRGRGITTLWLDETLPEVAVRPDGGMIAIAPVDRGVLLVDPAGAELGRLPGIEAKAIGALRFTPDGARLWAVEERGDVIVWDLATRELVARRRLDPLPDLYVRPRMSPDGRLLAVDHPWYEPDRGVAWSGQITLLGFPELAPRASIEIIKGDEGSIKDVRLSVDGKQLVVCATTRTASITQVYALPSARPEVTIRSDDPRVTACDLAPNGQIVIGSERAGVSLFDRRGKRLPGALRDSGPVYVMRVRDDGTIITGGPDGMVRSWGTPARKPVVLARQKHPVDELELAGELVIAATTADVLVLDTSGSLRARLESAPEGAHDVAAASGTVVVSEPMFQDGRGRVRIWRAPRP